MRGADRLPDRSHGLPESVQTLGLNAIGSSNACRPPPRLRTGGKAEAAKAAVAPLAEAARCADNLF